MLEKKKVIIDCDPGMDDSIAIVMALKSPALDVKAITTVAGNYPVDITSMNARKVLELIGKTDVPVAKGMSKPIVRDLPKDPFTHGKDGQAEANLPEPKTPLCSKHAVDMIIDLVKEFPNEIYIITTAPMTNVAMAILKAPEIVPLIAGITSIAGSFGFNKSAFANATGDNPQSEWNVYVDPDAADIVFRSGAKIMALGLDVTTNFGINFVQNDIELLKKSSRKEAQFLLNTINFVNNRGFESYCAIIDCMAVACTIDTSLTETILGRVGVETHGKLTLGMTVLDSRHHHVWTSLPEISIAVNAEYKLFFKMLMELVLA
jgi:inosine-uridine nucleoside N-ribohydrolase